MNKWMTGCVVGLTMLAGSVLGQDLAVRRATAEELLNVMKMPEMMAKSFDSVKQMLPARMKQIAGSVGETNMSADVNAQMQKMMDLMAEEFGWDKIKDDFISLYAETFTETEMRGMIAFYKTPAGQAYVTKQPELMKRSMDISQKVMMRVMPRIQALASGIKPIGVTRAPEAGPAAPAEGAVPAPPAAK